MSVLTPKQQAFVAQYLVDLNATQAAIRAGYSAKTAYSQGQRLLKHAEIQKAIAEAQSERAERIKIDADWVLRNAVYLHNHCLAEPVFKDGLPVLDAMGNSVTRVNVAGAIRALELVGKHVGVQAWQTKAVVDVNHDYSNLTLEEINGKIAELLAKTAARVGTKH